MPILSLTRLALLLIFLITSFLSISVNAAVTYSVTPSDGYAGDSFTFKFTSSKSISDDIKIYLILGDGGGGWLSEKEMEPNWGRTSFTLSRVISTPGDRVYKIIARTSSGHHNFPEKSYRVRARPTPEITRLNSVSPSSADMGGYFTFSCRFSPDPLPSGYSFYINFGTRNEGFLRESEDGGHVYMGRDCDLRRKVESAGSRMFRIGIFDSNDNLVGDYSSTGYFTVNNKDTNAPTISATHPQKQLEQGSNFKLTLELSDQEGNLRTLGVDWGDGSSPYSESVSGSKTTKTLSHRYTDDGTYHWSATVHDSGNNKKSISGTVSVTPEQQSADISVISASVSPTSAVSGSTFTFTAELSDNLTSGYQVQVDIGAGYKTMNHDYGRYFKHSQQAFTTGNNRSFTVRVLNDSGQVLSTRSGTYTVEQSATQNPPTLRTEFSPAEAETGIEACVQFRATDPDSDLNNLQINWGDNPSNTPDLYSYAYNTGDERTPMCHTYGSPGTYFWRATVIDHHSKEASTTGSITVTGQQQDTPPSLQVSSMPSVSGNLLTASINIVDDKDITRTSFTVFQAGSATSFDSQSLISVSSPASSYNASARSWGYNPTSKTEATHWSIDISRLPEGNYEIEFYATDGVNGPVKSGKYSFNKSADIANTPGFKSMVTVAESRTGPEKYDFEVQLDGPLPDGYSVFLNFDDQQGSWFKHTQAGGHFLMENRGNHRYGVNYTLVKPGLRSFRAGIFKTHNDSDRSNDELVGSYTDYSTCLIPVCIAEVITTDQFGDPAQSGSGSQLYRQVDVANGNYHLALTDLAVPGIGPNFAFSRTYNSSPGSSRRQGQWTFGYEARARFVTGKYNRQIEIGPREDGRIQHYFKDMDQQWYPLNAGNFDQLIENADGSFVLYTRGNRLYRFANPASKANGRLTTIEDRAGNALGFSYTSDILTEVRDAAGRRYDISRDSQNRVKRITDETGRYVEYGYNAQGMLQSVRNPRGKYNRYSYVSNTLLASITDPRQNVQMTIDYDSSHRVSHLTDGMDNRTAFSYTSTATNVTLPDGHMKSFQLDSQRVRVERIVDGNINTTQGYEPVASRQRLADYALVNRVVLPENAASGKGSTVSYDSYGNPLTIVDEKNRKTATTYKQIAGQQNLFSIETVRYPGIAKAAAHSSFTRTGKATRTTDVRGHSSSRQYDSTSDLLTRSTDALNNTTHYSYDGMGNNTGIEDAKGNRSQLRYDPLGRLTEEVSPSGLTTSYEHDENGNVVRRTQQGSGHTYTTRYSYDNSDNLSWVEDPQGNRIEYSYDLLNRKAEERFTVDGNQLKRRYTYDNRGRLKAITNERNQTTTSFYTSLGQLKYRVNPLQQTVISYEYDKNGNVTQTEDAEGRRLTTAYDVLGRKERVTDSLGNYEAWEYSEAGLVSRHRDARGNDTRYEYDAAGNLEKVTDAEGGKTTATYDGNGNRTLVTDAAGHNTHYVYDELNRVTERRNHSGHTWRFSYDASGNLTEEKMPSGETLKRTYDAFGRVTQLTEKSRTGSIVRDIRYTYDANHNVVSKTSAGHTIHYHYDALDRVTSVTNRYDQTVGYQYDEAGNLKALTYPGNKVVSYNYDNANRLASLTDWLRQTTRYSRNDAGQLTRIDLGNGTYTEYSYDKAGRLQLLSNLNKQGKVITRHDMTRDGMGNITRIELEQPLLPQLPPSTGTMKYDENNRILSGAGKTFNHDTSGRIIEIDQASGQSLEYRFDINDRLQSIHAGSRTLTEYSYDQNNNRIGQTQNGTETRYIINEIARLPDVLAETDSANQIQRYYIHGEGLVSQIDTAGNSYFYHYNPTGHTLALTDRDGQVTDSYAYAPYGYTTAQGKTHNPFRYVGRYGVMDDGNGLHYMRARYYQESIKRFISLDVLMGDMDNPQSLNRYAYVLGNPILGIDPSGQYTNLKYYREQLELMGEAMLETGKATLAVSKDFANVYVIEPAQDVVNTCKKSLKSELLSSLEQYSSCTFNGVAKVAGSGLDAINPVTAIKASLRQNIRLIANGDEAFEKELQRDIDLVLSLLQIKDLVRNIKSMKFHRNHIRGAKQAIKTIEKKIDKRGLAANKSNLNHHYWQHKLRIIDALNDLISFAENQIKYFTSPEQ